MPRIEPAYRTRISFSVLLQRSLRCERKYAAAVRGSARRLALVPVATAGHIPAESLDVVRAAPVSLYPVSPCPGRSSHVRDRRGGQPLADAAAERGRGRRG